MSLSHLRIATRKSPLALWQAENIKQQLLDLFPGITIELVGLTTSGDKFLDSPLAKIGGKGLFTKELEIAMQEGRADLAVHSMKDVPMELPPGFSLAAICQRENPFDAFVATNFNHLVELPINAIVGTSSLRRQSQIKAVRPDLNIQSLRGNVNTRLSKLHNGEFQAIILAVAGLIRLNFEDKIKHYFTADELLPAAGQGALGIECLTENQTLLSMLKQLNHTSTEHCVRAERAVNRRLGASCQVPIAAFAEEKNNILTLRAQVGSPDGQTIYKSMQESTNSNPEALGNNVANELLELGAGQILEALGL